MTYRGKRSAPASSYDFPYLVPRGPVCESCLKLYVETVELLLEGLDNLPCFEMMVFGETVGSVATAPHSSPERQ